jgi:hypothetical protein
MDGTGGPTTLCIVEEIRTFVFFELTTVPGGEGEKEVSNL